jgi:hypothetical protein
VVFLKTDKTRSSTANWWRSVSRGEDYFQTVALGVSASPRPTLGERPEIFFAAQILILETGRFSQGALVLRSRELISNPVPGPAIITSAVPFDFT